MRYSSIACFEAYTNDTILHNKSAITDIVFIIAFLLKSLVICFNLFQETSFEFLIILDELLLDILKASGEQSMDVQRLEKEVLDRTGCDFSTLYEIIKGTEQGSHGVEDFILKDSNFFELKDSMVRSISQFSPHRLGEKIDLDFSRQHISSCRNFVDWCLLPARDARSIVLAYCTIGDKTWPFGVLDLLLWFCPLLEEVDLTGCVCLRRSNFIKSPPPCRVIDHECLSPSYLLNSDDAVEKISDMLSHDHLSFSLHSNGWTLLHSAVLLGSQELVKSFFAHYKTIGNDNYFKSVHFKTALELAITLHRCDILELFKEISPLEDMSPSLFLHLCFYPKHGMTKFKHPFEIVTSNKDALRITEKLHAIQDCNLTRLLQTYLRELDITFKEEMLKKLMRHLEEYTRPDNSYPNNPCWNDREVCEAVKILVKETGCSVHGKVEEFPYLMLSMPNVQLAEFFIQEGVRIDEKDQEGHTCLFHAVEKAIASNLPERWYNFITFLLKNKANPNERDDLSETPLLYSLSYLLSSCSFGAHRQPDAHYPAYGNYSGIQAVKTWSHLLEAEARPNAKDENDRFLLHVLLSLLKPGHLTSSQVREIFCKGISILKKYEMKINSSYGNFSGIQAVKTWSHLLEAEARPNAKDENDRFLLHVLLSLLKPGHLTSSQVREIFCKGISILKKYEMKINSSYGNFSGIQAVKTWSLLLEAKARPNAKDENDRSLLHVLLSLLKTGHLTSSQVREIVCKGIPILEKYEMKINSSDSEGNTALHMWASLMLPSISDEMIKIGSEIVSHGGNVNSRNNKGDTPFHMLVKEGFVREDLVEPNLWSRILALGMNPWIANCDGKCPFEVLLGNESFGSAFTFLKAIFEDDQNRDMAESARRYRNMSGDYLLHTLCIVNNENVLEICEYLLVHGCEVNVQNECKQTPLHLLCNKVSETDSSLSQQTIHFTRLLERYNADMTLSDIYGNTCKDMLSKYQRLKIPKTTKWISESIVHKAVLSEVVLGKNSQNVENYHYHTRPIGKGTFSCVFPAINKMDGREVALKRLEKARLAKTEGMLEREISCLLKLSSCPNVVNYITCTRDSNFEYIVIELMEGSLDNYLSSTKVRSQALTICSQIALGMKFLHGSDVLHRDLKPQNILYRTKPEFIVKLSDFGLSKFLQQTSTDSKSVMHSKAGTRCWMAPELLAQTHEGHSKATDIYSCGILFHYVVSGKKHPFSSSDKSLKSNLHEIEQNIYRNKMHLCSSLSPEAFHLITEMLSKDPESRPTASSLRKFPFFWDDCRKVEFLKSVGDLKEFKEPRIGLLRKLSGVESKLETFFSDHFHATIHWSDAISNIYDDLMFKWPKRVYGTKSAVELVRFIRNAYVHADILEKKTRKDYLEKFVVLKIFPYLVTDLYKAIKGYSSWKNRKDMKQFF